MKQILERLGYSQSPQFLRGEKLEGVDGYAHIFRTARDRCALKGVYVLRPDETNTKGIIPLVYVCEAKDENHAREIHRQVWNQSIVPFLLVKSPQCLRLYKGFSYNHNAASEKPDTFQLIKDVNDVLKLTISADDIEQGEIWNRWGKEIDPDKRVNRVLLENLEKLGDWLTKNGVDIQTAHALIGKYVYLRYLRDRDILSNRKLRKWGINPAHLFERNATLTAFEEVSTQLEEWLNGSVFPLPREGFSAKHIKKVAGVFFGDDPGGQLHLAFLAYDFSVIPTETLSSIYEQFLHATDQKTKESRGKKAGAYYTPVSLVNFTVSELEIQKPFEEGMKVLDPSCGSGAFLVQCYRRLIEKKLVQGLSPTPHQLKKLLVDHIFGVELYEDACQVAALSLILTLLDNVRPPDLETQRYEKFKLPALLDKNIFCADFFDPESKWSAISQEHEFDWIIGNPPWKEVKSKPKQEGDIHARNWMVSPENTGHPVTDNQLAEAFTWKVRDHLSNDGVTGLILPGLTLTKQNTSFRKAFFSENRVCTVVNFANLRRVLFQKKKGEGASASNPAAVICFRKEPPEPDDIILSYAPFVIDQVANRPVTQRKKVPVWNIAVNSSDLQELAVSDVCDGSHLHWTIAMWGSPRDMRLLKRLQEKFESFAEFRDRHGLQDGEGFQLRKKTSKEPLDHMPKLIGQKRLQFKELRDCDRIFEFPPKAIDTIKESECYVRKGRGELSWKVSSPPHIILDAARRFAVYSNEFLAIPSRQIGIAGTSNNLNLLKALAAYLNSYFAVYHEFLDASEWGIKIPVATLCSLRHLPIPQKLSDDKTIVEWASLYDKLVKSSGDKKQEQRLLDNLNSEVFAALRLRKSERILVEDMVKLKLELLDGKVPEALMKKPNTPEMESYLREFQRVLDAFITEPYHHEVTAWHCDKIALIQVCLLSGGGGSQPRIVNGNSDLAKTLQDTFDRLRHAHSQWLYFDRCLKVYDGPYMYILKPLQMSQWTCSKALSDADDVIGEFLMTQE